MKRYLVVLLGMIILCAQPAQAQMVCTTGASALWAAMDADMGGAVLNGLSWFGASGGNLSQAAVYTGSLGSSFPTSGGSFAVLSTGNPMGIPGPNTVPNYSYAWSNSNVGVSPFDSAYYIYDRTTLLVDFTTGTFVNGLGGVQFDFEFSSEEYEEYVGTQFSDYFGAFLGTSMTGLYSAGNNISYDQNHDPITINTTFSHYSNTGTQMDATTRMLRTTATLASNTRYYLGFQIADASDAVWDSNVFLDNFKISEQEGEGTTPEVPEPGSLLLLGATLGAAALIRLRARRR